MILALDVLYNDKDNTATVGGVVFKGWSDAAPVNTYKITLDNIESEYEPGFFYKRELPCLLKLIELVEEEIDTIVIDGYVKLGASEVDGLGMYLAKSVDPKTVIIGVAKNPFGVIPNLQCIRGSSKTPLFITSHNIDPGIAKGFISSMHGKHRIPTLLKLVDHISRGLQ